MKKRLVVIGIIFLTAVFSLNCSFAAEIKEPSAAGVFYPDNPKELASMLDDLLTLKETDKTGQNIFSLILPHAGYGFSGKTASLGYSLLKGKDYKTVVIIGTSHHYPFNGVSVYPSGFFATPLGSIEIDSAFTQELLNKDPEIYFEPRAFEKEHSLEVQLPFLQKTLTGFSAIEHGGPAKNYGWKIVPLIIGDCSLATCQKLASLLKQAIGLRDDVLVIVSTDMYHGYDYIEADKIDLKTFSFIENMDAQGLYYGLREGKLQLCGGFGVVSVLMLSKELGYDKIKLLTHTNSAEVTGNKTKGIWTVGYASLVIEGKETERAMFDKEQKKRLLEIARKSIETYLKTGKKPELKETDPLLIKEMGAFVTLNKEGELRGCIGNLVGKMPLYLTIRDMAIEAAVGDPRFSILTLDELKNIEIEISVLSPMQRQGDPDKIRLGVDGVLVRKGFKSGVFLPQVATETGWSKEEFLSNLCAHKAGLPSDAWKDKDTEILTFTAEVFSEKEL
jgi:hypothetical protein